jgi:hypothetical protein
MAPPRLLVDGAEFFAGLGQRIDEASAHLTSSSTFAIMSQFHYGPGVRIVTCVNFELALL